MLSGGYVQLKLDWDIPCYLLSSRTQMMKLCGWNTVFNHTKTKIEFFGGHIWASHVVPWATFSNHGTTQFLGHLLCHQSCRPCLNSKLYEKVFRIELKQCPLWAQVSNFNLVKAGYYPLLPLAVIAFKVVHCPLLYIIYCKYCILDTPMFNHMA